MKKFFSILENIIGYTLFFAFTAFVILYFLGVIDEDTRMKVMGYIPYCYLGAAIVVLYKLVALVFTSFYQIKIEKRKEYLDEILAWQKIEEASTKQGDMLEQELSPFIENVKRMPEGNTDAVIKEIHQHAIQILFLGHRFEKCYPRYAPTGRNAYHGEHHLQRAYHTWI